MQADFHFTAHVSEAHEGDDCEAIVKLRLTMEANLAGACRNTPTKRALNGPDGMSKISEGSFVFKVRGIEIEGSNDVEVENPRFHIEICPITNAEFKRFLDASRCHPPNDLNFLRDWKNGAFPNGCGGKPVTWVSLEHARAYAKWTGKRLPHEWEWQYAAEGMDGRAYP